MLKFFIAEILDRFTQENFRKLDDYIRGDPFRKGQFRFYERYLSAGTAAYPATVSFTHQQATPVKDVIMLSVSPDTVTVTPKYDSFSRTHVSFEVSAACTIRAYVGRYGESN